MFTNKISRQDKQKKKKSKNLMFEELIGFDLTLSQTSPGFYVTAVQPI